jgi:hypothetical protein
MASRSDPGQKETHPAPIITILIGLIVHLPFALVNLNVLLPLHQEKG